MWRPHAPAILLGLTLALPSAGAPLDVRWQAASDEMPPDAALSWRAWTPAGVEAGPALPEHAAGAVSPQAIAAEVPDDLATWWWTVALEGEWGGRTWFAVAEGLPSAMPSPVVAPVPDVEVTRDRGALVLSWADPLPGSRPGALVAWQVVREGADGAVVVAEVPAHAQRVRLDAPARRVSLALRPLYRDGVAGPAGRFVEIELEIAPRSRR